MYQNTGEQGSKPTDCTELKKLDSEKEGTRTDIKPGGRLDVLARTISLEDGYEQLPSEQYEPLNERNTSQRTKYDYLSTNSRPTGPDVCRINDPPVSRVHDVIYNGKTSTSGDIFNRQCLIGTSITAFVIAVALLVAVIVLAVLQASLRQQCTNANIGIALTILYGGLTGNPFNDAIFTSNQNISAMNVWTSDDGVIGIQVQYGTSWAPTRGSQYGSKYSFTLSSGELVTKVVIGSNKSSYYGITLVCFLSFYTNKGQYGPYGNGCTDTTTVSLESGLAYLAGRDGVVVDALMFYYYGQVTTSRLYGASSLNFDDTLYFLTNGFISQIQLTASASAYYWLRVQYGTSLAGAHGVQIEGSIYSMDFSTNEFITNISVSWNANAVCSLSLGTTVASYGPYKVTSCQVTQSETVKMSRLLSFVGSSDSLIEGIGFRYVA